jgi:hypothetical protein
MEVLSYDPVEGTWTWLVANSPRVKVGWIAGCLNGEGYRKIKVDRKTYSSNRLAWLYMTGEWPADQIDHRDRNPSNDRWSNLRKANNAQNQRNKGISSNNMVGVKGVGRDDRNKHKPFRATIKVNGKRMHLGSFATIEAAKKAYSTAAERYFGTFARAA